MNIGLLGLDVPGQALAFDLVRRGFSVYGYDYTEKHQNFSKSPVIFSEGEFDGHCCLKGVISNLETFLAQCNMIFIAVPAYENFEVAKIISPFVTPAHTIVLVSSWVASSYLFVSGLSSTKSAPTLLELNVFPYAARKNMDEGDGHILVGAIKNKLRFYVKSNGNKIHFNTHMDVLLHLFPQLTRSHLHVENILSNPSMIIHSVLTLNNIDLIKRKTPWMFYQDGFSHKVFSIIQKLDLEKQSIAAALGIENVQTVFTLFKEFYPDDLQDIKNDDCLILNNLAMGLFQNIPGPTDFSHRFFLEDISLGIYPLQKIATKLNIKTPTIDALVNCAQKEMPSIWKHPVSPEHIDFL